MSREIYEFDHDGFLFAEKIQYFIRNYIEKCKADSATHEIVFVLYGWLYYPDVKSKDDLIQEARRRGSEDLTEDNLSDFGTF